MLKLENTYEYKNVKNSRFANKRNNIIIVLKKIILHV